MTTAIIPAAGLGTRLNPITGAIPKELVPVYDSVALYSVCEEVVRAGVSKIIIVNSPQKPPLADPVRRFLQHQSSGRSGSKFPVIEELIQEEQLGLGHAVSCAVAAVEQYPAVVVLPDVLLDDSSELLLTMLELASDDKSVICVKRAVQPRLSRSGVIGFEGSFLDGVAINELVEKPAPGDEPSDYMVVGRYVLTEEILKSLADGSAGSTGEIELTDAISSIAQLRFGSVVACELNQKYQDTGTIDGLFLATLYRFAQAKSGTRMSSLAAELISQLEQEMGLVDS